MVRKPESGNCRPFGLLFGAGEVEDAEEVGESVVDASEVINTLECGGLSSVAYASSELDDEIANPGILKRLRGGVEVDKGKATNRIRNLVKKAVRGRLTVPVEVDDTERALVVLSGPNEHLTRRGMEHGRTLTEEKTESMEVRGGDYPRPDSDNVSAAILMSGLYDIPRVRELQRLAVEASDKIQKAREERSERFDELLQNEDVDELDDLLT